jgi:hypothetical protein
VKIFHGELRMTPIKEKALDIITRLPDDKVVYFYNILQNIEALSTSIDVQFADDSMAAFKRLIKYKGALPADFDFESELDNVRVEKYEKYARIS